MVNQDGEAGLTRFLDETKEARLESYKGLLRIPSISGIPAHAGDCRAAAEYVAAEMRALAVSDSFSRVFTLQSSYADVSYRRRQDRPKPGRICP